MLTTGLLSLNIHDYSTFEGTELCLHPDLFSSSDASVAGSQQSRVTTHTTNTNTGKGNDDNSITNKGAAGGASTNTLPGTAMPNSQPLSVGDMIEIRVWDVRENNPLKSPGSATVRTKVSLRSSSMPQPISSTNSVSNNPMHVDLQPSLSYYPRTTTAVTLQYPEPTEQQQQTDDAADNNDNSTSSSKDRSADADANPSGTGEDNQPPPPPPPPPPPLPTKTVITQIHTTTIGTNNSNNNIPTSTAPSMLPPIFPRTRASTGADAFPNPTTTKPPSIHRRIASTAGLQKSPKLGFHRRDISDMTADTQHLDIVDIHPTESHDTHDDATAGTSDFAWSKVNTTHKLRLSFVYLVTEKTLTTLRGNARTQISILRQVADLYALSSFDTVTVHKIESQDEEEVVGAVSADFVLFTIKDQFISRGDMHYFQKALIGSWIYEGQRIADNTRGIKAHAREIRHGNFNAKSGIVTDKTMITFRSRSSRIIWLVQLSSEMWDYTSPYEHTYQPESLCEIYFDQWIRFIYKLFTKWKELEVTHSLTVIFFSRTFLSSGQKSVLDCKDIYGRTYEDHFKPIIENETCVDWESLIVRIKEEFIKYPLEVGWNLNDRRPSTASQGNVLEAVNVTLNVMQYHFMDRDLHRTGNSIVVISPGCGVFEVDRGLAGITYQRMMDNGIGSDMLSLGLPPLHIAPFFLYNNDYRTVETQGVDASETYYEVPHWMHLSFINYDREEHKSAGQGNPQEDSGLKVKNDWYDFYEVGANGFLRPKIDPNASPTTRDSGRQNPASSFSAVGNAAATPGKPKSTQERQLISGRDFRDILEACRPRMSGMRMPSALTSLLKLQQLVNGGGETAGSTESKPAARPAEKPFPLREWGTVDFSEMVVSPIQRASRGDSFRKSPLTVSLEKTDGSESGSNSSMASHVSSLFGISYDRVLWEQYESPSSNKKTIQIQRSPSLEFDNLTSSARLDSDITRSEDSLSLDTDNVSRSSGGKSTTGEADWGDDNDAEDSRVSKSNKHIETLRRMMDALDTSSCIAIAPSNNDDIATEIGVTKAESSVSLLGEVDLSTTPRAGVNAQNLRNRGKEKAQSGGLGAALSQYNGPSDSWKVQDSQSSIGMTRRTSGGLLSGMSKSGGQLMANPSPFHSDRIRSSSPFLPRNSSFFQAGISPMLLPPITNLQQTDLLAPEQWRNDETGPIVNPRGMVIDQRGFQHREGLGLISMAGYDHGGEGPHPLGLATLTSVDGTRNKLKPISRSPPPDAFRVVPKAIPSSPPSNSRERSTQRMNSRDASTGNSRHSLTSRRKKAFNPFRQSDEDEVLAKKSHNRRRWSHVFPVGEVEFKRHSGPIWNSLTSPAILPLSVDYFPSPHELRDPNTFQFSPYTVTLGGLDRKHYTTHAELMMEMVRQRVTQDFQIVTSAAVEESETRAEVQRPARNSGKQYRKSNIPSRSGDTFKPSLPTIKHSPSGTIKHYLSMGHRIQVLSYDPSSDTIEIVHYNKINAQNDPMNIYTYDFLLFSRPTQKYTKAIQTFKKYAEPYKWNKVDNIICGESDRILEEGMRFRRVMFGLIPQSFKDAKAEKDYIAKFRRLLDYLEKLREKEDPASNLKINIVSTADESGDGTDDIYNARRSTSDSMIRFTVQLRKGKRDPFEWIEMAVDSTFDTTKSYRIMFNWLVASSAKVEGQVQILHRRCTQYGLQLITFPQTTIASNLFLHAFAIPTLICVRSKEKANMLEGALKARDFVSDGIHFTEPQVLECIEDSDDYDFPRFRRGGRIRWIPARQYVHRTGALFIRDIRDRKGWAILACIENRKHATPENGLTDVAFKLIKEMSKFATSSTN